MPEQNLMRIVVVVEGGLVQRVFCSDPLVAPVTEYVVIDWDANETEGQQDLENRVVADPTGESGHAYVQTGGEVGVIEPGSVYARMIAAMDEFYASAPI